ncbi:exopolysaccharide production protein ExoZ [Burkholderia latens]|uniref:acyltransferase family protein n=1 Tax=Burkholderia latens TaxID=488446 RepID=UPI0039A4F552
MQIIGPNTPGKLNLSFFLSKGENNFDLIRLIAATTVIFGHVLWVKRIPEPIFSITGIEPASSIGVYAFFLLSGILVTQSFVRRDAPFAWVIARLARVLPGLLVCTTLTAFVIGALVTNKSLVEYFTDDSTYAWWLHASTLFGGLLPWLPGVFQPLHTAVVNVPLWTLPIELKCYLIVLALGVFGLLRTRARAISAVVVVMAAFLFLHFNALNIYFINDMLSIQHGYKLPIAPFFFVGMAAYILRDRIQLYGSVATMLAGLYLICAHTNLRYVTFFAAMVYGILWLATTPMLRKITIRHDYSYGLYIYGFVVQQCLDFWFPSMGAAALMSSTLAVTILIAAASWHCIEKPAIRWARRLSNAADSQEAVRSHRASPERSGHDTIGRHGGR